MAKVEINGHELELHLLDADVMERYDTLTNDVRTRINDKTQYEGKSNAECLRLQCRIIDEYLDGLFGAGTAEKCFQGNKGDMQLRLDAFAACVEATLDTDSDINNLMSKYSARLGNRRERRAAQREQNKALKFLQ